MSAVRRTVPTAKGTWLSSHGPWGPGGCVASGEQRHAADGMTHMLLCIRSFPSFLSLTLLFFTKHAYDLNVCTTWPGCVCPLASSGSLPPLLDWGGVPGTTPVPTFVPCPSDGHRRCTEPLPSCIWHPSFLVHTLCRVSGVFFAPLRLVS